MNKFEHGTYFFRPEDNDLLSFNAKFKSTESSVNTTVKYWITPVRNNPNKWGIRDYDRGFHRILGTPCILTLLESYTIHGNLDCVWIRAENGFEISLYLPLVEKLIEMKFLTRLLPHEEASNEFGLI